MPELGRRGGKIGGKCRLETMTPEERSLRGPESCRGPRCRQAQKGRREEKADRLAFQAALGAGGTRPHTERERNLALSSFVPADSEVALRHLLIVMKLIAPISSVRCRAACIAQMARRPCAHFRADSCWPGNTAR